MKLSLSLQKATDNKNNLPARSTLIRWIKCALAVAQAETLSDKDLSITIRLVDALESADLNQQYRHKSGATNILSFAYNNIAEDTVYYLGDLVICVPLVLQEASDQHKSNIAHFAHLVLHGVLHLLGYDHIRKKDAVVMEALEIQAMQQLGYQNPY